MKLRRLGTIGGRASVFESRYRSMARIEVALVKRRKSFTAEIQSRGKDASTRFDTYLLSSSYVHSSSNRISIGNLTGIGTDSCWSREMRVQVDTDAHNRHCTFHCMGLFDSAVSSRGTQRCLAVE